MKILNITTTLIFVLVSLLLSFPGQVVTEFDTPCSFPVGLTFDGKNLWLSDYKADALICIDPGTGKSLRQIPSPGFWPAGLAWDGSYLWNVDSKQKKIFKVDPKDGGILFVVDSPTANPEGLTWDGQTLWVSDPRAKKINRIDLSDGTAVKTLTAPAQSANGLTFDGFYLWCADRLEDEIYMLDPESGKVIIIFKSPGPYPRGLAWDGQNICNVDFQNDKIYMLVRQDNELFSLDDTRHARVTLTHEVKTSGNGLLRDLNVYYAIPENLNQQEILNIEYSPETFENVTDRWDQRFAYFHYKNIKPETPQRTIMTVETKISAITYYIFPDKVGSLNDIPADLYEKYTANGSKYKIDDPYIQKLAKEVVGDERNPYWIARRIFDYIRTTLEYKLEGGWNVAPVVLQRGTGSCSEYSFSFIALCRAAGLPARYVGAVVVRGDETSLDEYFHRWPEVYLPHYGWIPIDPQGGDKDLPRDRANSIGRLSNRFLITTQGGGDSKYIGWYYNSYETWTADPQVQVNIETFGEWQPVERIKGK